MAVTQRLKILIALGLAVGCSAEGGGGGGGDLASCTQTFTMDASVVLTNCIEIAGPGALMAATQSCSVGGGLDGGFQASVAPTGCSHVGAGGGCATARSGVTITAWYYGVSPNDVRSLCGRVGATYVAP